MLSAIAFLDDAIGQLHCCCRTSTAAVWGLLLFGGGFLYEALRMLHLAAARSRLPHVGGHIWRKLLSAAFKTLLGGCCAPLPLCVGWTSVAALWRLLSPLKALVHERAFERA